MPGWVDTGLNLRPESPVCTVKLNTSFSPGIATDLIPVTSWKSTAEVDTHSMYHYNSGGSTWIEIPFAGRYLVHVHTIWAGFGIFDPNKGIPMSTSIAVNGTTSSSFVQETNAVGHRDAQLNYDLVCDRLVFAAGDKIRVNFWSQYGGQVQAVGNVGTNCTYITVRYLGPN